MEHNTYNNPYCIRDLIIDIDRIKNPPEGTEFNKDSDFN